jgi:hypothetical protein
MPHNSTQRFDCATQSASLNVILNRLKRFDWDAPSRVQPVELQKKKTHPSITKINKHSFHYADDLHVPKFPPHNS